MSLTTLEKATFGFLIGALCLGICLLFVQTSTINQKNAQTERDIQTIQGMTDKEVLDKSKKIEIDDGSGPKLNINFATLQQIDALPGVGKVTADRIIEFRTKKKGKIEDLSELSEVQGMSPKKISALSRYLGTTGGDAPGQSPKKLNLNFATEKEIDALPGVGGTVARAIVEYRMQHGAFRSLDDLENVPGLTEKAFKKFEDLVEIR